MLLKRALKSVQSYFLRWASRRVSGRRSPALSGKLYSSCMCSLQLGTAKQIKSKHTHIDTYIHIYIYIYVRGLWPERYEFNAAQQISSRSVFIKNKIFMWKTISRALIFESRSWPGVPSGRNYLSPCTSMRKPLGQPFKSSSVPVEVRLIACTPQRAEPRPFCHKLKEIVHLYKYCN